MVTLINYFEKIDDGVVASLPETLVKGHSLLVKTTNHGQDWDTYEHNERVKNVIDQYVKKLNEYLSIQEKKASRPVSKPKQEKQVALAKKHKPKNTKEPSHNIPPNEEDRDIAVNHVGHIAEEIKFIKRFVGLHNKVKSSNAILSFIKSLQRSIVQRLIRKTSPLASEIEMIQDKLVRAYNKMKDEMQIKIDSNDLARLVAIAGGEDVYPSVRLIKRFIGMQEREATSNQIDSFLKQLANAFSKEKILKDDPYADKLKAIHNKLKTNSDKIALTKTELSGLEGIVKACACRKNLGTSQYLGGTQKLPPGVLTAEQMANRKLDLLPFTEEWLSVFGRLGRNFTMMIHGEPFNGKTVLLLKFSKYLAENFGKVLYVSSEEHSSPTMTKKINEWLMPFPLRLHFAENLVNPEISEYDFVIFDSVNDLGMSVADFKTVRKENPDVAFIFILQHTKDGKFKGGKDWEHLAEVVGEVVKGVLMTTKNRYHHRSLLKFLDNYKDSTLNALPNAYPVAEE